MSGDRDGRNQATHGRSVVGRGLRRGLRRNVLLIGIAVVVVLAALGVWGTAMVTPVTRAGQPTAVVSAPLSTASVSPSPTPASTATPSSTGTPTPGPSKAPTMKSSGTFDGATLTVAAVGSSGALRRYTVRVETSSGLKANQVAAQIAGILNDPRSWTGSGGIRFGLVKDATKADFRITVAAPGTAAKTCQVVSGSCVRGSDVVIDAQAWKTVAGTYAGVLPDWQTYLVNHGLGTLLGEKPATCTKRAKPAPVMMPQADDLLGCTPNPWPYP